MLFFSKMTVKRTQRAKEANQMPIDPIALYNVCTPDLLTLFRRSILKEDALPISGASLEYVIRELRNEWSDAIPGDEWKLLGAVSRTKEIDDYEKYHRLLRNIFIVQYREPEGTWFDVNPVLKGAKKWADRFDSWTNFENAPDGKDPDDEEFEAFEKEGIEIWKTLRKELAPDYEVAYNSKKLGILLIHPDQIFDEQYVEYV
jgi:hypothetical protein